MAVALYATNNSLGGAWAAGYGFAVSEYGLGNSTYNIGANGAAFDVENNTVLTVMDILKRADDWAVDGVLYYGRDAALRKLANNVFDGINTLGDLG